MPNTKNLPKGGISIASSESVSVFFKHIGQGCPSKVCIQVLEKENLKRFALSLWTRTLYPIELSIHHGTTLSITGTKYFHNCGVTNIVVFRQRESSCDRRS